jgi:anti-sigma factor ChrR (cupin superfamily)
MSARPPSIACDQVSLAELFAFEALPSPERAAFATHLDGCACCQREIQKLQPVLRALDQWPGAELPPPESLWNRLAGEFEQADVVARRFSELPELEAASWEQPAPGIYCKILATDAEHRVSMLVRLDPGVEYPPHTHAGVEELHLLDGELWIDDRKLTAGDFNRAEPGTVDHRVWSETGCTCVLITSPSDVLG